MTWHRDSYEFDLNEYIIKSIRNIYVFSRCINFEVNGPLSQAILTEYRIITLTNCIMLYKAMNLNIPNDVINAARPSLKPIRKIYIEF